MKRQAAVAALLGALVGGCAGGSKIPVERLASTQAAVRAAEAARAMDSPRAALHLRLAQEQLGNARRLLAAGEDEQAGILLRRAQADAELALAVTREQDAAAEARAALEEARAIQERLR